MERWMQVHQVMTKEQQEALQPKPEPDQYDCWMPALSDDTKYALELLGIDPQVFARQMAAYSVVRNAATMPVLPIDQSALAREFPEISCHCLVGEPGHPCG